MTLLLCYRNGIKLLRLVSYCEIYVANSHRSYTNIFFIVQNARECLKTRWRVLSRSLENTDNHSGVKRHADGKVIVAIHRRKKRKVADESTSKSMSNKSFAHSEQLHTREKEWECITSRSRDADGNTRYEGNSLSHEEADKDPKPRVKKERKTWDYRYNELLDFKNKVSWYGITVFLYKNVAPNNNSNCLDVSMDTATYPKSTLRWENLLRISASITKPSFKDSLVH